MQCRLGKTPASKAKLAVRESHHKQEFKVKLLYTKVSAAKFFSFKVSSNLTFMQLINKKQLDNFTKCFHGSMHS